VTPLGQDEVGRQKFPLPLSTQLPRGQRGQGNAKTFSQTSSFHFGDWGRAGGGEDGNGVGFSADSGAGCWNSNSDQPYFLCLSFIIFGA
jgi:hypothetical protein